MVNVWASSHDVHAETCFDARLEAGDSYLTYPQGTLRGQAGWHVGFNFTNFDDLLSQLQTVPSRWVDELRGKPGWLDEFLRMQMGRLPLAQNIPFVVYGSIYRLAIHCHGAQGKVYVDQKKNSPWKRRT
jgi:hypothetical protein